MDISKDGKLLDATLNGQPIDEKASYRVATLDYLAEGNDQLTAFKKERMSLRPNRERTMCASLS